MYINLLAPRRRRRFPLRPFGIGLLVVAVIAGIGYTSLALRHSIQAMRLMRAQADGAAEQLAAAQRRQIAKGRELALQEAFTKLQAESRDWPTILNPITRSLPAGGKMTRIAYDGKGALSVEGYMRDLSALVAYLQSLESTHLFTAVRVVSALNEVAATPAGSVKPGADKPALPASPAKAVPQPGGPPGIRFALILELPAAQGGAK